MVDASLLSEWAEPRELADASDTEPPSDECVLREDDEELEEEDDGEGGGQERPL